MPFSRVSAARQAAVESPGDGFVASRKKNTLSQNELLNIRDNQITILALVISISGNTTRNSMERESRSNHNTLSNISRKSDDVADYYDSWAAEYDENLGDWRYQAPERVASLLRTRLSPDSEILDAGCGTGLSGRALYSAGFTTIDGIDISIHSLAIARTSGAYRTLQSIDMQKLPFPIPADHYDGLVCVGVLTYLPESTSTLREFCRLVRPQGIMVVTQRSDLFIERSFSRKLEKLSDEGFVGHVQISDPQPYLPDNEEFSDQILVHYITCKVL